MQIAKIEAEKCVGCTKCIDACPVDAIVGAPQMLHTVIDQDCIGCKLCISPCPMDCIIIEQKPSVDKYKLAAHAKTRYQAKIRRLKRKANFSLPYFANTNEAQQQLKNEIEAAVARVKAKRSE